MGAFLRKYGTGTGADIWIPLIKRDVVDAAVGADFTPAAGDVKISIDGAAVANIGTLPVVLAAGNTAWWKFVFTDAELQGKRILISISDSATKAVEDQFFVVETFGHASAMYPVDFSDGVRFGLSAVPNAPPATTGGLAGHTELAAVKTDTAAILLDTGTDGVVVAAGSKTGYSLTATTGLGNQTANITGTISTVTNLTNAPTAGDFTATMKTSLNAATPAVTVSDKTGFKLASDGLDAVTAWSVTTLTIDGTEFPLYFPAGFASMSINPSGQVAVGSIADNTITAASIADGAIDTATFASGATLPRVTLVDTTTANTDMRGTDSAATAAALASLVTTVGAAGAGLTEAGGTGDHLTAIPWNASWDAEVQSEVIDALQETVPDTVPADGSRPNVQQAVRMILQALTEGAISGTTWTVRKEDGSTALLTVTLDSSTPTSKTRAS